MPPRMVAVFPEPRLKANQMNEQGVNSRADEEADRLYRFLGKYIVTFQWLEAQLDQILLLANGHENWGRAQIRLAGMRNIDKISAVEKVVMAPRPFGRRAERPGWTEGFEALLERLRHEGRRRNGIVHSQYLFEFVEAGLPVLRSDRRRKDGVAEFEREDLDSEQISAIFNELAMLAIDLSQARLQLVHWYAAED